jgi:hypothetical protein
MLGPLQKETAPAPEDKFYPEVRAGWGRARRFCFGAGWPSSVGAVSGVSTQTWCSPACCSRGTTTRRNEILINVTVVGEVRAGRAVERSGARPHDILYASGRLGEAELGLQIVRRSEGAASKKNPLTRKHIVMFDFRRIQALRYALDSDGIFHNSYNFSLNSTVSRTRTGIRLRLLECLPLRNHKLRRVKLIALDVFSLTRALADALAGAWRGHEPC